MVSERRLRIDVLSLGVVCAVLAMLADTALREFFPRVAVFGVRPSLLLGALSLPLLILGRPATLRAGQRSEEWIRLVLNMRWVMLAYWTLVTVGNVVMRVFVAIPR